jgi:hypothetical protein
MFFLQYLVSLCQFDQSDGDRSIVYSILGTQLISLTYMIPSFSPIRPYSSSSTWRASASMKSN